MLNPANAIWQKVERRLARVCERKLVELKCESGLVCFTFDDAPRSACVQGAAVLEKHGVNGTYYVCGGLTGTNDFHTRADLLRLADAGHRLGCHGYGHRGYQSLGKDEILADIRQNRSFFEDMNRGVPRHFAYPYGHVSPAVKRLTAQEFVSSRGIQPGINHSTIDLTLLKSYPLYQHLWTERALAEVIERADELRGLLIFFTHGVRSDPGRFDCSSELLDFAVRTAAASGNKVLPVADALAKAGIDR